MVRVPPGVAPSPGSNLCSQKGSVGPRETCHLGGVNTLSLVDFPDRLARTDSSLAPAPWLILERQTYPKSVHPGVHFSPALMRLDAFSDTGAIADCV